ncbi:hypothetical protein [Methylobacterium sp. 88A]|uniref:hypothetical protein n=1 Tax=Methylobacterium sp. 88A TaxID=1131813 RepID=UPI0012F6A328|nr:hypothetical protein [Methylobacterium sp. 88A]
MALARRASDRNEVGAMNRPVDAKARERIRSARLRELEFQLRSALSNGGYSEKEVDGILSALMLYVSNGQPVSAEGLRSSLLKQGFPKSSAEQLSRELATA